MEIKLGAKVIQTGDKAVSSVQLGFRPDGSTIGVPMMGIVGAQPGPVLGIITGVHGDEYEGPEAVRQIFDEIDPQSLKGAIICTPQANMGAFDTFSRAGWIDHLDMNRSFPGRADGFMTQRVAHALVSEIVEQSNYLLDLHSAGLAYDLEPYVGFTLVEGEVAEKGFNLAKSFGIPYIYSSSPFPNVLRLEAYKRDIPAILVEVGGEGRCRPEGVEMMKRGIFNVLSSLDMLSRPESGQPETYTIIKAPSTGEFIHSPTSGYMRSFVKVGDRVSEGQKLAEIADVYGAKLDEVISPYDGLVLIVRSIPSIRMGDWAVSVVYVTGDCSLEDNFEVLRQNGVIAE